MVELSVADRVKTPLNRFRLDGQVAIVKGDGNGIGRATAELLVEAGAAVALIDRDERAVEKTKVALLAAGVQVEAYIVDVIRMKQQSKQASPPSISNGDVWIFS
jgi:NAD(P)-dependent dehydrogenase (short-subunit alcohol dehydrogenase family)